MIRFLYRSRLPRAIAQNYGSFSMKVLRTQGDLEIAIVDGVIVAFTDPVCL